MNQGLISFAAGILLCLAPTSAAPRTAPVTKAPEANAPARNSVRKADVRMPPAFSVDVAATYGIAPDVLSLAMSSLECAAGSGAMSTPRTLTVIDYSLPSTEPRLWVIELATGKLLYKELVAHGRNTGENMATHFSDELNSRQTSLGLFVTRDTYKGSNGYSLRLDGLEPGFNGHARERAIVMHGAPYVDTAIAQQNGRLGRSWGCPALRPAVAREVIDTIRDGGAIFSYYPDPEWLRASRFLNACDASTLAARSSTRRS